MVLPARSDGGTWGGYPQPGVPPSQVWWGYLRWGTPWQGYPTSWPGQGVPQAGGPPPAGTPWPGLTVGTWGGVPPQEGYPLSRSDGGTQGGLPPARGTCQPGLRWGTPQQGYPHPDLAGGTPGRCPPWLGVPPAPTPSWTWLGYPPLGFTWSPPPPPPPRRCGLTKWNYNHPSRTTYAVGNQVMYSSIWLSSFSGLLVTQDMIWCEL